MSSFPGVRIAIVGAGPAGFAFARILLQKTQSSTADPSKVLKVALFDRDLSPFNPVQRPQGGSLDLHQDSGQLGIRRAGVWDAFVAKARYEAQGWRVDDKFGQVAAQMTEEAGKTRNKPEIGRADLRNILAEGIEELAGISVHWGMKVIKISEELGSFRLHFEGIDSLADQSSLFDAVIGADGTWSQVRTILNAPAPRYSGMTIVETSIDPNRVTSTTASMVGNGSYMAVGARKALMAQRNSDGSVRVYIALTVPETWAKECGLRWTDAAGSKETILTRHFDDWGEIVKNLVKESGESELRLWPLFDTPRPCEGGKWRANFPVTLLGDAAHVMPPWTGRGVNMALLDSVELGYRVAEAFRQGFTRQESLQALQQGMRAYEEEMWTRMDKEKGENIQSQALLFSEGSPTTFRDAMKSQALVQS